jgi:hypothetical protein
MTPVLVQAEEVFALFVAFLDPPSDLGDRDHVRDRGGGRGVDQKVADLGGIGYCDGSAGCARSVGGRFAEQGDGEERLVVVPLALGPGLARTPLPPGCPFPPCFLCLPLYQRCFPASVFAAIRSISMRVPSRFRWLQPSVLARSRTWCRSGGACES